LSTMKLSATPSFVTVRSRENTFYSKRTHSIPSFVTVRSRENAYVTSSYTYVTSSYTYVTSSYTYVVRDCQV
jgi:hypothetical protein